MPRLLTAFQTLQPPAPWATNRLSPPPPHLVQEFEGVSDRFLVHCLVTAHEEYLQILLEDEVPAHQAWEGVPCPRNENHRKRRGKKLKMLQKRTRGSPCRRGTQPSSWRNSPLQHPGPCSHAPVRAALDVQKQRLGELAHLQKVRKLVGSCTGREATLLPGSPAPPGASHLDQACL